MYSTLPSIESLNGADDLKKSIYVPFCISKFLYQLDPFRKGKLRIIDLMKSTYLTLFGQLRDGGLSASELNVNPFYVEKAVDLFEYYEELRTSESDNLQRLELNELGDRAWNPFFLDALYSAYCERHNGMASWRDSRSTDGSLTSLDALRLLLLSLGCSGLGEPRFDILPFSGAGHAKPGLA